MTDWDELDERDGMPVHVRMGLTKDGQGPADPPDPNFDHWGCWCDDVSCPGPPPRITCPSCGLTSYNPNDIRQGYCGLCHDWTSKPPTRRTDD